MNKLEDLDFADDIALVASTEVGFWILRQGLKILD